MSNLKQEALKFHEFPVAGKIKVVPTKSFATQRDLALAYSPGVAEPCLEIEKNPQDAYRYTAKGNLVAVIPMAQQCWVWGILAHLPVNP